MKLIALAILAFLPLSARAQDISAQNRGLPGIHVRTESRRAFTCVVLEITHADHRAEPFIGREFSPADLGRYTVLNDVHVMGETSSDVNRPHLLQKESQTLAQATAELSRNPDCGAGERELTDAEWKEEFERYLAELDAE